MQHEEEAAITSPNPTSPPLEVVQRDREHPAERDNRGTTANRRVLVVLLAATALSLINSTVANVAIPAIQKDLHLTATGLAWALAGWALTYALALVPAGVLGDRFGQRTIFVVGLSSFATASAATVLVQTEPQLVVCRLVQGATAGLFYPAIAATLTTLFHGQQRSRAFGALGATIGAGAAVGPIIGGSFLEILGPQRGWRALFLLNVPIALLIVAAALLVMPKPQPKSQRGFDLTGFALLAAGLAGALVPLIVGPDAGWPGWCWAVLGAGIVVLAGFVWWERQRERGGRATVVSPAMFANRDFSLAAALGFTQFAGLISIFYILALLWQTGLGRSALEMGLLTLPEAIASILGAALVAALTARLGSRRTVVLGAVALTTGIAALSVTVALVPAPSLSVAWLVAPLFLTGLGGGVSISATINHALSAVDRGNAGAASGAVATLQRVGNAVGLAVVGGVFFAVLANHPGVDLAASYATSTSWALAVCSSINGIGIVLALSLRRTPGAVS